MKVLILILLSMHSLTAQSVSGGSCSIIQMNQCMNFVVGITSEEGLATCTTVKGKYSGEPCPRVEIAGICNSLIAGKKFESIFYFPGWTVNQAKERCTIMKGIFY
jgi:hypothetical protein